MGRSDTCATRAMNLLFLISTQRSTGAAGIEYGSFNDDLNDMHDAEHYTAKNQIQTSFLCPQANLWNGGHRVDATKGRCKLLRDI